MTSLNEIYGNNYKETSAIHKCTKIAQTIGNNLANEHYRFRLSDINDIWNEYRMKQEYLSIIMSKVSSNKNLIIHLVDISKENEKNALMYFIQGPVEYFIIIDKKKSRSYIIYITPLCCGTF